MQAPRQQANHRRVPALAGPNLNALLDTYGVAVEANTALRAVPHAAALHPAEPLVTDGVLTTALAAALGFRENPEQDARAAQPLRVAAAGGAPEPVLGALGGASAAHGAEVGKPWATAAAVLRPRSATGRPGTAGSRRPGTAGAREGMQLACRAEWSLGRLLHVHIICLAPGSWEALLCN